MASDRILIVDDDKNIRLTLSQALTTLPAEVETAEDGAVALTKIEEHPFSVVFLDLRMPSIDGMEVLRRLRDSRPDIPVVIISAHGTIDSAIEVMKLGAVDFLQKPFSPDEIRGMAARVLDRRRLRAEIVQSYADHVELARKCVTERQLAAARKHLETAIALAPKRPEAFNMLGALHHLQYDLDQARKYYRVALDLDPACTAADDNLRIAVGREPMRGPIKLGDLRENMNSE
jgi:DNA-binding NtrC family response regulator